VVLPGFVWVKIQGKVWVKVWVSDLVFGFRLDPSHNLLEFIG